MSSNNKSIDNYLESARKFKSPVSADKARSLIEMSEIKNSVKKSFISKIGIKIMTFTSLIVGAFVISSIIYYIFDKTPQNQYNRVQTVAHQDLFTDNISNEMEKSSKGKVYSLKAKKETQLDSININKVNSNSSNLKMKTIQISKYDYINQIDTIQNIKIIGMNSIKMSDKEFSDFGIQFDSVEIKDKYVPCIGFWIKNTSKAAGYEKFAKELSTHAIVKLPSEKTIQYLKLQPDMITDFDGTKRFYTSHPNQKNEFLDEFMPFNKSLSMLYNLDFNKDYISDKLPEEIIESISDLQKAIAEYQAKLSGREKIGVQIDIQSQIDKLLKELYPYFSKVSQMDSLEFKNMQLSVKDTNMTQLMVLYSEKEADSTETAYIEQMAKMGIKLVYTKPRLTMQEFMERNFPELESNLTFFKKQIDDFIMINKMVAVEIPYKNDPNGNGLIFWYYPNQKLIDALPERFRSNLANEFKLLENEGAICGSKPKTDTTFLDIWRACNGAIENLRVFPNPVKNIITARFELKENRAVTIAVHDLNGLIVRDLIVLTEGWGSTNSFTFDISDLKPGMYLIVASTFAGEVAVQRFIKE